jgi:hypothetical protein
LFLLLRKRLSPRLILAQQHQLEYGGRVYGHGRSRSIPFR